MWCSERAVIARSQLQQGNHVSLYPWMIEGCGGDLTAAVVLGHMAFRTFNGQRWHTATIGDIAAMTGLTEKQARRGLDVLRELNHVESRRVDKWNPTLEWNLILSGDPVPSGASRDVPTAHHEKYPEVHHETPTEGITLRKEEEVQEEVQPVTAPPRRAGEGRERQFSLMPSPASHRETAPTNRFDEFWTTYPKKVDKAEARKSWAKAIKTTPPGRIIAALNEQKRTTWRHTERQFIPNPTTWLNRQRWNDELQEAPPDQRKPTRAESIDFDR